MLSFDHAGGLKMMQWTQAHCCGPLSGDDMISAFDHAEDRCMERRGTAAESTRFDSATQHE